MNDLCVDIGWQSLNHDGEQLCGDHVDILEPDENSPSSFLPTDSAAVSRPAFFPR